MRTDETTLGERIRLIRLARGRWGEPQLLKRFTEALNFLLEPADRVHRSDVIERWEANRKQRTLLQGVALAKLDPLCRGVEWLAGIRCPFPEKKQAP